jgi:hypothetical protein
MSKYFEITPPSTVATANDMNLAELWLVVAFISPQKATVTPLVVCTDGKFMLAAKLGSNLKLRFGETEN